MRNKEVEMSDAAEPMLIEERLYIGGALRPASGSRTFENVNPASE